MAHQRTPLRRSFRVMSIENDFIPEDEFPEMEGPPEYGEDRNDEEPENDAGRGNEPQEIPEGRTREYEGHGYRLDGDAILDNKGEVWPHGDAVLAQTLAALQVEGGGMLFVDTVEKEGEAGIEFFHTYYTVDGEGNVSFFIDKEVIAGSASEEEQPFVARDEDQNDPWILESAPAYIEPQAEIVMPRAFDTTFSREETHTFERVDVAPREQGDVRPARTEKDTFTVEAMSALPRQEFRAETETVASRENVERMAETVTSPEAPASMPYSESRPEVASSEARAQAPDQWLTRLLDIEPLSIKETTDVAKVQAPEVKSGIAESMPEVDISENFAEVPVKESELREEESSLAPILASREQDPVPSEDTKQSEPAIRLVREGERPETVVHTREPALESPVLKREMPARAERFEKRQASVTTETKPNEKPVLESERGPITERFGGEMPEALAAARVMERAKRLSSVRSVENSRPQGGFVNADEDNQTTRGPRIRLKRDGILMEIAA